MPIGPTTGERIIDLVLAMAAGLVAFALMMTVVIVLWRRGTRQSILLFPTGLVVIAVGLSASAAVRLVGVTMHMDTSYLALGTQVGATVIALALFTIGLVRQRRRASVR